MHAASVYFVFFFLLWLGKRAAVFIRILTLPCDSLMGTITCKVNTVYKLAGRLSAVKKYAATKLKQLSEEEGSTVSDLSPRINYFSPR